jgi:hypothetical protein
MSLSEARPVQAQPTELYDCVGEGADFCFDSTGVFVDESCGALFYRYRGNISWPALKNVGPVTISVLTRNLPYPWQTHFPLYVEVRGRTNVLDGTDCRTGLGGDLILVAQGGQQCGGTWESIGPIELREYGVPDGANYSVQLVFFEAVPYPDDPIRRGLESKSIGFSCIRVTSHPEIARILGWSAVKRLYQ